MPRLNGAELIAQERQRQIDVEGYTPDHDDIHNVHQFIEAAATYIGKGKWPWDLQYFKFVDGDGLYTERNLVKAGALIAAAIDRLQRAEEDRLRGVHL